MKLIVLLAVVAAIAQLSGCTINKEKYTSGLIGCPEDEIQIVDSSGGMMANTWTAKCRDKVFYCTYRSGSRVDCTESILSE